MPGLDGRFMEITSMANIPGGAALGSSGSFTAALLHAYKCNIIHPRELADGETFDLSEIYGELAVAGRLADYEVRRFYEIGSLAGLAVDLDLPAWMIGDRLTDVACGEAASARRS